MPFTTLHDVVPWFDVRLYGADPTGVADSTNAINAAITNPAVVGSRATVFIPRGEYLFTRIRLKSRVCLMGQGNKTTLNQRAGFNGNGIVLDSPTVDKASIRSPRLNGNKGSITPPNRGIFLAGPPRGANIVTLNGDRLDVPIVSGTLPAGGAAQNGRVLIEGGGGNRLVWYVGGNGYRVTGTQS